ncbi:MAG TPA: hypothetical protein VL326_22575 [Kofleriaceae bacterium]|nr:hypothetical protein [Kofleriaceae bacterium]
MSRRTSLFVASLLWGVSLSLVAYRFAVMPLIWHSPMRIILPGLACGLFISGLQISRMRPKASAPDLSPSTSASGRRRSEPSPVMAMLGLFALGFLPVFAIMWIAFPPLSRSPLVRRALPGFSVALPAGEKATEAVAYPAGSIMLKHVGDGSGVVVISWEPGGKITSDELRTMLPIFTKAMQTKDENGTTKLGSIAGPDGKPIDTVTFDTDNLDLELSMLTCGVRHMMIATAAASGVMPLHQRIVASFECKPDAAQESTATTLAFPLALDLPGWYLVGHDEEVTQISSDTASLVLRTLPPSLTTPDLATFIGPAFEQTGAHVTIVDKQGSDFLKVKLEDQGDSGMGWVALFRCPTGIALVLGLGHDDASVTALYDKVKASRCLKPGEGPTQFPVAPQQ